MNRILLLIKKAGKGAAEQLFVNAAPYVDKDRFAYQVARYLLPWKDALVGELEATGIPSTCLDGSKGIGWIRKLKEFVKSEGIDLILIHSPYAAVGARVSLNGKLPMVYTEHNMWQRYRKITYWGSMFTFGMNDHVFAVSETVRTSICYPKPFNFLQLPPAETLYQGIDPNKTDPCMEPVDLEATFEILKNKKVVGTVVTVLTNDAVRERLASTARSEATRYDISRTVTRTEDMYGKLLTA